MEGRHGSPTLVDHGGLWKKVDPSRKLLRAIALDKDASHADHAQQSVRTKIFAEPQFFWGGQPHYFTLRRSTVPYYLAKEFVNTDGRAMMPASGINKRIFPRLLDIFAIQNYGTL